MTSPVLAPMMKRYRALAGLHYQSYLGFYIQNIRFGVVEILSLDWSLWHTDQAQVFHGRHSAPCSVALLPTVTDIRQTLVPKL